MVWDLVLTSAALSAALWGFLILAWGGFWRADQRLAELKEEDGEDFPEVIAVIPARNEASTIGETVRSLLTQTYGGALRVVVVDDNSDDGTAEAAAAGLSDEQKARLEVVSGAPLEAGWTGKLWAVSQGIRRATEAAPDAAYLLLTDADIAHDPRNVARLVAKAETGKLDLVSLMVRLRCESFWERLLIPAFVFFFQKLYPFPWVNAPGHRMAAAAGGCMLVRRAALEAAGGIAEIKARVIDDCALARLLKQNGPIWLGLTGTTRSIRPYEGLGEIWRMVARTAFVQLDHSVLALLGTFLGMALLYLLPPAALGTGLAMDQTGVAVAGGLAWALMTASYLPTLKLYERPMLAALWLPVAGTLYTLMTLDSARRHWQGRGGAWKGRTYAAPD